MSPVLPDTFFHLHQQPHPLLLPNIWDPASAALAQKTGAQALATSSAALAWACGYADGEQLPARELLGAVGRLMRVAVLPLTVDIEQGYSEEPEQVAALVLQLAQLGVAGINLEDGTAPPALLAAKISACRRSLGRRPFFINARTDVFLHALMREQTTGEAALAECRQRLALYQAAGADGGFMPGLSDLTITAQLAASLPEPMPLNLMGWPQGATCQALVSAGVQRLSAGPALFLRAYQQFQHEAAAFCRYQQPGPLTDTTMNQLLHCH